MCCAGLSGGYAMRRLIVREVKDVHVADACGKNEDGVVFF